MKVLRGVHSPHSWNFKKCNEHDDVTHKRAHDTEPNILMNLFENTLFKKQFVVIS